MATPAERECGVDLGFGFTFSSSTSLCHLSLGLKQEGGLLGLEERDLWDRVGRMQCEFLGHQLLSGEGHLQPGCGGAGASKSGLGRHVNSMSQGGVCWPCSEDPRTMGQPPGTVDIPER